jgi:hypothetical protein
MELRNNEYLVSVSYPTMKLVSGEDRLTATKCLCNDEENALGNIVTWLSCNENAEADILATTEGMLRVINQPASHLTQICYTVVPERLDMVKHDSSTENAGKRKLSSFAFCLT